MFKIETGLIALLIAIISIQWYRLQSARHEALALQTLVDRLKQEAYTLQDRYNDAREKARDALLNSNKEVDNILSADVSTNCKEAMTWGVRQAKGFTK